ncbi:MAG: hypothetical protein IPK73_04575 [Candidatus Obscuribacter sp.]|nr:hypothetical protein [Candidatus Obscuribacter sp.]MBK9280929.1 hypothetical protein [Candidatus Obscuribacter sp.]
MSANNFSVEPNTRVESSEQKFGKVVDSAGHLRTEANALLKQVKSANHVDNLKIVDADGSLLFDLQPQEKDFDTTSKLQSDKAIQDMSQTLRGSGMSDIESIKVSRIIHERFTHIKEGASGQFAEARLKGTPVSQMERVRESFEAILKPGQDNFAGYNMRQKQNVIRDLAYRLAAPNDFVNQGNKGTCALQALQKQQLFAGDPAKVIENAASVLTKGYADLPGANLDGSSMRVHVMKDSLVPDSESAQDYNNFDHGGGKGMRGLGGQALDALYGQAHADHFSIDSGLPTSAEGIDKAQIIYLTAGAQAPPFEIAISKDSKGEALLNRTEDGHFELLRPYLVFRDLDYEWLNKAFGGKAGAILVHESNVEQEQLSTDLDESPQHLGLKHHTFKNAKELIEKAAQWEEQTGQPVIVRMINASLIEGQGGLRGESLHVITATAAKKGLRMDNQGRAIFDRVIQDGQIDLLTNNKNWSIENEGEESSFFKKAQAIVEDLMTTAYESYLDFNTQIYKQSEVP